MSDIIDLELQANNGIIQEYTADGIYYDLMDSRYKLWAVGLEEITGSAPSLINEIEYLKELIGYLGGTASGVIIDDRKTSYGLILDNFSVSYTASDIMDLKKLAMQAIIDNNYTLFLSNKHYLEFDGATQYITLAKTFTFAQNKTVCFWAKYSWGSNEFRCIFGESSLSDNKYIAIHTFTNNTFYIRLTTQPFLQIINTNDGNWHFYAIRYDSSMKLRVDETDYILTGTPTESITMDLIALGRATHKWKNDLDELYLYDKLLSDAELMQLYGDGTPETCGDPSKISDLLSAWRLEEGSGSSTEDIGSEENDGTLIASPNWGSY